MEGASDPLFHMVIHSSEADYQKNPKNFDLVFDGEIS